MDERLDRQEYTNDAPLIGVISQPHYHKHHQDSQTISGPLVSWVESAGGRVLPIRYVVCLFFFLILWITLTHTHTHYNLAGTMLLGKKSRPNSNSSTASSYRYAIVCSLLYIFLSFSHTHPPTHIIQNKTIGRIWKAVVRPSFLRHRRQAVHTGKTSQRQRRHLPRIRHMPRLRNLAHPGSQSHQRGSSRSIPGSRECSQHHRTDR